MVVLKAVETSAEFRNENPIFKGSPGRTHAQGEVFL